MQATITTLVRCAALGIACALTAMGVGAGAMLGIFLLPFNFHVVTPLALIGGGAVAAICICIGVNRREAWFG